MGQSRPRGPRSGLAADVYGVEKFCGFWVELARHLACSPRSRIRQLQELRQLDDHLLADIGLSRRDPERANHRPPENALKRDTNDDRDEGTGE
jgi:uncharacterized protein YjiS (DUF1127 family)